MFQTFFNWLDNRTGYRKLREAMLLEHIPGGAKWRYVWGSVLTFVFVVQLITGVLLMTAYSPGSSTAWGSVYYIQYNMDFGWLIRGLHHYGSQTMVVLLGLHMLQVVIAGAHLAPREINWWLGLGLLGVVLGLSLTGYLLPWDEKGFWASQVATNIISETPLIGPFLQKVVVGGTDYGHQTLTHFYALHVGILPPLLIVLLIAHIAVFRRHGVTTPKNAEGQGMFWPQQAFRDLLVSLVVFGIMLSMVVFMGHGHPVVTENSEEQGWYEQIAKAGRHGVGANLDAPADRETQQYPARPEWYFLFLFQLLKYFEGDQAIVGTILIPGGVGLLLFILPLLGYGKMRKFGHFFGILVVVALLASVGVLTVLAFQDDAIKTDFQQRAKIAEKRAARAVQLAKNGIPEAGGQMLLRRDPKTRGRLLFKKHCAVCHSFTPTKEDDFEGFNNEQYPKYAAETLGLCATPFGIAPIQGALMISERRGGPFRAADLGGWGTEEWMRGLLENPGHLDYFGRTNFTEMIQWREKLDSRLEGDELKKLDNQLDLISKFFVEANKSSSQRNQEIFTKGKEAFFNRDRKGPRCYSCHTYNGEGGSTGPDLTDYGSQDWLRLMIMAPTHSKRYHYKNQMPLFVNTQTLLGKLFLDAHKANFKATWGEEITDGDVLLLSDIDRELIIRFITRDYRVVFGGEEISGAKKN